MPRYCAAPKLEWAARPDPTPVLLASGLEPAQVEAILQSYGLHRIQDADANLQSMAGDPHQRRQLADILPALLEAIGRTADPDQALNHWERWLASGVSRSAVLEYLRSAPRMLDLVCAIFGNSDSLAFTLVRDPLLLYWLAQQNVLSTAPTRAGMERTIRQSLESVTATELKLDALRRFRRREMLRIGVRDLLRLADVVETTASLSDLASVLIDAAYRIVDTDLRARYGIPMHQNRQGRWVETGFTVIGMGKLGGHELNYSSDVDVLYVCESHEGETRPAASGRAKAKGPAQRGLSNEEYFEILARELTKALTEQTHEGYRLSRGPPLASRRFGGAAHSLARRLCQVLSDERTSVGTVGLAESLAHRRVAGGREIVHQDGAALCAGTLIETRRMSNRGSRSWRRSDRSRSGLMRRWRSAGMSSAT